MSERPNWRENPAGYRADQVGEDDYGRLWVCARRDRNEDEPKFRIRFRRRDPRCWGPWLRSWRRGEMTCLETL